VRSHLAPAAALQGERQKRLFFFSLSPAFHFCLHSVYIPKV